MFGSDSTLTNQEQLIRAEAAFLESLLGGDEKAQVDAAKRYREEAKQNFGDSEQFAEIDSLIRGSIAGEAVGVLGVAPVQAALGGAVDIRRTENAELSDRLKALEKMLEEQRTTNRLLVESIRSDQKNTDAIVVSQKGQAQPLRVGMA
jgi:hypothetical protein